MPGGYRGRINLTVPTQLDILALEPYYGGFRREMLETLARNSRHRWRILKLPPRRLERRLATASRWFAEQLSRHSTGHCDALFVSEALNLADFFRLIPSLARKPSVVYFHSHQLGDGTTDDSPSDYANLSSASAATELWFSSRYGRRDFFSAAQTVAGRDAELMAQNVLPELTKKSFVICPPVDGSSGKANSDENAAAPIILNAILLNANGIDLNLLIGALSMLRRRNVAVHLNVIGPTEGLTDVPLTSIASTDASAVAAALAGSILFLSASPGCAFDEHAVRTMSIGRPSLLPRSGGYVELVSAADQHGILYPVNSEALANALQRALTSPDTVRPSPQLIQQLHAFEALSATRLIDERLAALTRAN